MQPLLFVDQLAFQLRELAIFKLGGPIQVILSLGLLDGLLNFLNFLFQTAQTLDRLFFRFPTSAQLLLLRFEIGELFLELGQTLTRGRIALLAQRFTLDLQLHDPARNFVELGRHRLDLRAELGGGLVNQIDGFVRQETVGDVAMRQHGRGNQRGILDAHAMVHFVALAQPAQDRNRILDARLVDEDGLEPAFEGAVFLDVLAISSRVVGPMQRSSPRASMGLSRLEASIEPSAAPAPTTV